jgi:hypothetical protein
MILIKYLEINLKIRLIHTYKRLKRKKSLDNSEKEYRVPNC